MFKPNNLHADADARSPSRLDDKNSSRHLLHVRHGALGLRDPAIYDTTPDIGAVGETGAGGGEEEEKEEKEEEAKAAASKHVILKAYEMGLGGIVGLLQQKIAAGASAPVTKFEGASPSSPPLSSVPPMPYRIANVDPGEAAAAIVRFEAAMAKCHVDPLHFQSPERRHNVMSLAELESLFPMDWQGLIGGHLFGRVDIPADFEVNVETPSSLACLTTVLEQSPIEDTFLYLEWSSLLSLGNYLDPDFIRMGTKMSSVVTGQTSMSPRYRKCLSDVLSQYGYAISRLFMDHERAGPAPKAAATDVVEGVREAFLEMLARSDWMDEETKRAAHDKALAMRYEVGHPDFILDDEALASYYENASVTPAEYLRSAQSASRAKTYRDLHKLLHPVDNDRAWQMSPMELNAYYSPTRNLIILPEGILRAPFFDPDVPASVNYGAIGSIVGHEFSHGFDSMGRQYGTHGNLRNWWSQGDAAEFDRRAACFEAQYSNMTKYGVHLNGSQTLGENIADNTGLALAYSAFKRRGDEGQGLGLGLPGGEAWSPDQLFFLGFAQVWCNKKQRQMAINNMKTGVHSLGEFRVNGVLRNSQAFSKAFSCGKGSPMNPDKEEMCSIYSYNGE